jgi:hypothetical protein
MEFGETLLEFSKGTFFHNVLDGFFFCTAFTRRVFTNVPLVTMDTDPLSREVSNKIIKIKGKLINKGE